MYPTVIPTREQFIDGARAGHRLPIALRRLADLETPISLYQKLRAGRGRARPSSFLLESAAWPAAAGGEGGRYSFLGTTTRRLVLRQGRFTIEGMPPEGAEWPTPAHPAGDLAAAAASEGTGSGPFTGQPWELVRQLCRDHSVERADLPLPPFVGGLVGYIGYDAVRTLERVPDLGRPGLPVPDACLLFTDVVLAFDHAERSLWVLTTPALTPGMGPADAGHLYDRTLARLQRLLADLEQAPPSSDSAYPGGANPGFPSASASVLSPSPSSIDPATIPPIHWPSTFTKDEYVRAVRLAQQHIQAGDIFQVVLSQRLVGPAPDSLDFYRALRMVNPSPYLFHLDFGSFQVAGSSPEVMVRLQAGRAQVRPIAGTRPRGQTPQEQARLEGQLRSDRKEQAEHVMLVDLGRNDLGRVCGYGTVQVPEQLVIERYSHVCHLVSQVEGILRPDKDAIDLLQATFPAGTVSGAPKVRAMEIIESLEPVRRGVYAGAVGYLGWDGNLDTCIAIRTGVILGGSLYVQAGAGIVADSVPEREYEETLQKAAALLRTAELLAARGEAVQPVPARPRS